MLTKNSNVTVKFTGVDFGEYSSKVSEFVNEFSSRANQKGQFLNWVNLPENQAKRVVPITYHPPITKNLVCMPIPLCVYERERRIIKHRSDNCFFSVPSIITKLFRCIFYFQRRCRAVQSGKLKRPCICRRRCILPDLLVILARVHMNHNMFYL